MKLKIEPFIRPLPDDQKVRRLVEEIIEPSVADREARAFCELIMAVANAEDEPAYAVALTAAHHAYSMTGDFERAFEKFVGYPVLESEENRSAEKRDETAGDRYAN